MRNPCSLIAALCIAFASLGTSFTTGGVYHKHQPITLVARRQNVWTGNRMAKASNQVVTDDSSEAEVGLEDGDAKSSKELVEEELVSPTVADIVQKVLKERRTATSLVAADSATVSLEDQQKSLREALDRAVECAQMAPNHKRTEPFSFRRFLAGSEAATKLADISYEVTLRKTESIPNAEKKRKKWLDIQAFLVVLAHENHGELSLKEKGKDAYKALPYMPPETERQLEDYAAASAAVQNVLLSLHSEGIGSKWATGPVVATSAFRKLVQASPTDRVVALIMIGGTTKFGSEQEAQKAAAQRRRRRAIEGDLLVDLE